MFDLDTLKTAVRGYLQMDNHAIDGTQGDPVSIDAFESLFDTLFEVAVVNAKKYAESFHDFEACRRVDVIAYDSSDLPNLNAFGEEERNVRAIKNVWFCDASGRESCEVKHVTRGDVLNLLKRRKEQGYHSYDNNYSYSTDVYSYVEMRRLKLSVDPVAAGTYLKVEYYEWSPHNCEGGALDWILEHGFQYMLWATLVELNHLNTRFIPRQEGTLAPPTTLRDEALMALVTNDVYSVEAFNDSIL